MKPRPQTEGTGIGSHKLKDKVAIITGGDSGIGRSIAIAYAREGADVAIVYLNEHRDARETRNLVEREGRRCVVIAGNVGNESFCRRVVDRVFREFGRVDILVNNAAEEHPSSPAST
jgi:NAD(P)-dependent dehydrogenase (short-subunit alcohol dehydrogenase family)